MIRHSVRARLHAGRFAMGGSLLALTASLLAAPAAAQSADGSVAFQHDPLNIGQSERVAQSLTAVGIEPASPGRVSPIGIDPAPLSHIDGGGAELTPQIVIANPGTPTTARDPNNVTGVGQMIVDQQNGFIGLCTGTLINPRTVIFAAHCVNDRPASAYGQDSGGQPIGFGFGSNNNAAGASAFGTWLNGPGAARYATNPALFMYDVNYVSYNPLSTQPNAAGFLYGDVAMASLDAPAANVPTWALLFSALPATTITAAGTGYHVTIDGYGNNGTGTTGSTGGIDFRRRIAENTLGALASLGDFEQFLFGPGGTSNTTNPQNLYWIDFDDPRRGTPTADPRDFNAWRDNALPNEGITASGDSGGPLILDRTFARSVVIGVLSGGYTRFFNGQPANGYGTAAFYQPLYLYWDWVAANNPYHYVSAVAGNGNWTDPTHWVTNLDPAYQVIVNGQLVNGIPTSPGAGNTRQPGFGQACFQSGGVSDCYDVATGTETVQAKPIGTGATSGPALVATGALDGTASDDSGQASIASLGGGTLTNETVEKVSADPQSQTGQAVAEALPAATLANGLPGATNFVPDNFDGNRLTSTLPRYFDVTLSATGTTTLNTAVTIDRFTLAGAGAMLDIQTTGSLTSLIGVTQGTGTMQVNGTLTTPGDYMMLLGGLNGTGTITAPFFTSIAGTLSPGSTGAAGTIGTLNFRGNMILASGTAYMVDLGTGGTSDRLAVAATTFNGTAPTNGVANVGGVVLFSRAGGALVRSGDRFTIVTAQGGVTGTFSSGSAISAILTPAFLYLPTAVDVVLQAGLYANVVDRTSAVQTSFASILDANRTGNYGNLSNVYGPLDLESQANIRAFFEAEAPRAEAARTGIGIAQTDTISRMFRQRLHTIDPGNATGGIAMVGRPIQFADASMMMAAGSATATDAGAPMVTDTGVTLPDNMSGYLAGGYIDGDSRSMPVAAAGARDQFDGWYVSAGLERTVSAHATIGMGFSYSDVKGTTSGAPQRAGGRLAQGTIYGALRTPAGLRADMQIGAGLLATDTRRTIVLGGTPNDLRLNDHSLVFNAEAGLGYNVTAGSEFSVVPRVSLRYESIGFDNAAETGGPAALVVNRAAYRELEGRAGMSIGRDVGNFRPYIEANYVHDFLNQAENFGATFVGAAGFAPFALGSRDNDWGEIGGGIAFDTGHVQIAFEAETTVARDDVRNQSYRARLSFHF